MHTCMTHDAASSRPLPEFGTRSRLLPIKPSPESGQPLPCQTKPEFGTANGSDRSMSVRAVSVGACMLQPEFGSRSLGRLGGLLGVSVEPCEYLYGSVIDVFQSKFQSSPHHLASAHPVKLSPSSMHSPSSTLLIPTTIPFSTSGPQPQWPLLRGAFLSQNGNLIAPRSPSCTTTSK